MPKAVKNPVEVEFCINKGANSLRQWCKEIGADFDKNFVVEKYPPIYAEHIKVKTMEGHSYKVPFNYIVIRGVDGEFYPCDPAIFAKTYYVV